MSAVIHKYGRAVRPYNIPGRPQCHTCMRLTQMFDTLDEYKRMMPDNVFGFGTHEKAWAVNPLVQYGNDTTAVLRPHQVFWRHPEGSMMSAAGYARPKTLDQYWYRVQASTIINGGSE